MDRRGRAGNEARRKTGRKIGRKTGRKTGRWLARLAGREDGNVTIEFALFFPLFMFMFLSSVEVGIFLFRSVMLERSVDINVRTLRLGQLQPATTQELKNRICDDTLIFKSCSSVMSVELTPISTETWNVPSTNIPCVDRTDNIEPVVDFTLGGSNDLMLVRVCMVMDPFFPTTPWVMNLPLDESGGYKIAAVSTFVNEP